MFFPFLNHTTVDTTFPGSNQNDNNVLFYTTTGPCVVFVEPLSTPGCFAGYRIFASYTNSRGRNEQKDIYAEAYSGVPSVSNFTYLYKSGIGVFRFGNDDDCSGTIRLHILNLPTDMGT